MAHAGNTKIWAKIISAYAKNCSITGFSSLRGEGEGGQKTQVHKPSRGMNAQKSDLISDPDVGKAFEYYAPYPGVMEGSQEGKRAKLWGPRAHFGANISMKIVYKSLPFTEKRPRKPEIGIKDGFEETRPRVQFRLKRSVRKTKRTILMFLCARKFSDKATEKVVSHLLSYRIFRN